MRISILFVLFISIFSAYGQVSLTTIGTAYTENFSALTCSATNGGTVTWTNNSNLTGWYAAHSGTFNLMTQLSGSTRSNTGRLYAIIDAGDKSLGSRASGGTGTVTFGVRLQNNTGTTITSLNVSYYGEQWSIAENGANFNTLAFHYQTGATLTSTTAGTWTPYGALDFDQIWGSSNSAALGGTACGGSSNQCLSLNGNTATNRVLITACIDVTIPAGQEIMLRWQDVDDSANDHHLQIDDVSITPFTDDCSTVLPLTWGTAAATYADNVLDVNWNVYSETNNQSFTIEAYDELQKEFIPLAQVPSIGDHDEEKNYRLQIKEFYSPARVLRIRQTDLDGRSTNSTPFAIERLQEKELYTLENGQLISSVELLPGTTFEFYDTMGNRLREITIKEAGTIVASNLPTQQFLIGIKHFGNQTSTFKIVLEE